VDGRFDGVLEPGRYDLPRRIPLRRRRIVDVVLVDVRERELTIKGQEILTADKVAAQRLAEAQLVEARTKAEREALEATSRADAELVAAQARGESTRLAAEADARAHRIRADAEVDALNRLAEAAAAYAEHPALLRVRELETLSALAANPGARLYIGFDKHSDRLTDR
jgi:regulator of protease activity HflC (stomatin/prohibitin superfamily)